jgi:hypothetical protein
MNRMSLASRLASPASSPVTSRMAHRNTLRASRSLLIGTLALVAVAVSARVALAGPPLICHPFSIGTAQSLAWTTQPGWRGDVAGYDVNRLADETLALLTPSTPVIVRMETLRRAAIYARRDEKVADQVLTRLVDRTHKSESGARAEALAWFDAGYFVETFRQAVPLEQDRRAALDALVAKVDGYAMVQKALTLRGTDPAMEFAAAIITLDHNRADQPAHAAKARDGAKQDALLAQNIDMLTAWATK